MSAAKGLSLTALRKIFSGAFETQDDLQYMHYVDICAGGSIRLARLLKMSQVDTGAVEAYINDLILRAIARTVEEQGLY